MAMHDDTVRLLLTTQLVTEAEHYFPAPEKLLAGNPQQTVWMHYADPSGRFSVGVWRSEPGAWRIRYTEDEYCELLEGVSVVTDAGGRATTLRAGDTFVIPRGFEGTWEVVETTTKRFVIHEPQA
jgi:uncharacterized cupin superfamily protein